MLAADAPGIEAKAPLDCGVAFEARLCSNPACRLRFPLEAGSRLGDACPLCAQATTLVQGTWVTHAAPELEPPSGPRLEALIDNVRSLRNVGAIFRTADGAGVAHLHLCGISPTPAHPKLAKTALGAETSVEWTRHLDAVEAAKSLREEGARLWALEGGASATSLFDLTQALNPDDRIVLILGHEVSGVDPRVSQLCERTVALPMSGAKGSLNVSTAFGVAAYAIRHRLGSA